MNAGPSKLSPYTLLDEPLLSFSPSGNDVDSHPLRGLSKFGPYTKTAVPLFTPIVRVAIVCPPEGREKVRSLLKSLRTVHQPSDRKDYVPTYPGFQELFGVGLIGAPVETQLTFPSLLRPSDDGGETQIRALLGETMAALSGVRDRFDVAVFHLPDSWGPGVRTTTFDAHDELKALGAHAGIPTQVLNDRVFSFGFRASVAWRLGIALYVKAGGIPWKLAPIMGVPEGTAYIGLSYALRGDPRNAKYVTCCSQVFDSDGGGMQFVAYDAQDPIEDQEAARRNPFLSRDDMRAVLSRSLRLYQQRTGGRLPSRVVIHKTTAFRASELEGANDALAAVRELECIEVTTRTAWRGVWLKAARNAGQKSEPDRYPVQRGTVQPLTGTSTLLWVAGNAPSASTTGNYYQGGKSIPGPMMITRHAGSGSLALAATEVLALSKMDWNNDALYDPVPVTIRYSQRLAKTIANVPNIRREIYPYRLFM
jgi:hypothetical protein